MTTYEVKQNPAPNEWAVLIWRSDDTGRKHLDRCVTFSGQTSRQLANDFCELMNSLATGKARIVVQ